MSVFPHLGRDGWQQNGDAITKAPFFGGRVKQAESTVPEGLKPPAPGFDCVSQLSKIGVVCQLGSLIEPADQHHGAQQNE
jgi:hypothetical protein